jgi:multicomponent K+:H+ antiporter subunit F
MIEWALTVAVWAVAAAMLLTLYRLVIGPDIADRILALDTLSVNAVALIILIDMILDIGDLYFEAALLIAMIGFVGTVAFCKYLLRGDVIE